MSPSDITRFKLPPNVPCLGVIVPVFNEGDTIAAVVQTVLEQPHVMEVVVVDDACLVLVNLFKALVIAERA